MISKIETNYKEHKYFYTESNIEFTKQMTNDEFNLIIVYPDIQYQSIIGFGGAFTEAAGYALSALSEPLQQNLLNDYFSSDGIGYTFCRTPINSCDFALDNYSYMDTTDISTFTIEHDFKYIIPMIKKSLHINPNIKLIASPWSPPAFMKDNNNMNNGGKLLNTYKQLWADYLVKYVQAYMQENIMISYMTIQNEPNAIQPWESCNYTATEEASLLQHYLAPTFKFHNIPMKFLVWDQNKERILYRINEMYKDKQISNFIYGIAYHYYTGDHFNNIALAKQLCPELTLIHTEGCTGYSKHTTKSEIKNAEIYAHDIIGDLNHGSSGYIDWNLVLDYYGGPNHKKNFCNAPIMTNKKKNGYYHTLSYYYIGHFSKFIKPNAKRIAYSSYTSQLEITSFQNPDNSIVVVVFNPNNYTVPYLLNINNNILEDKIKKHSIITYTINQRKDK